MKTNHNEPVIVIGAGIGGLTAAIALRQAGLPVRVFEQMAELREVGAGLTLWANALKVLERLGLSEALTCYTWPLTEGGIRNRQGQVLAMTSPAELQKRFGIPGLAIHRANLQKLLLAATGKDHVTLDARLVTFEQDSDGVTAHFSNGETVRGQALVGADGIHSVVREQLFGPQPLRYSGYAAWRSVVDYPLVGLTVGESWGRGARFGVLPVGPSQVYWFASRNIPAGQQDGPGGRRQDLLDLFGDWHAPIPDLLRATPTTAILRNDIYDRPPLRHWSQGRVTLLGDAAHPMTPNMGQGACQAIEDALVLAECLSGAAEPTTALQQYEQARLKRTNTIVRQSWQIGRAGQLANPLACWLRDAALRLTPPGFTVRQLAPVVGYDAGQAVAAGRQQNQPSSLVSH